MKEGQCLCGAVTFRAECSTGINACHCIQCQRWTGGGPYLSVQVRNLEISGEERVLAYHASEWGERGVCGTCGSTLFWRMRGRDYSNVAVGLLNDQSGLRVTTEIFVDRRPDWMPPFEGAEQSTEAEEMAKMDAFLAGKKA
ncbi:MAG: GFA family protein [Rhodobacteraceae bacterium]|nr:GFA family protein [Paracoccaceae bacterium]